MFVGGLVYGDKAKVIEIESNERHEHEAAVGEEQHRHQDREEGLVIRKPQCHVHVFLGAVDMSLTRKKEEGHKDRDTRVREAHEGEEDDEDLIVSPSDAVAHPGAVVVEAIHAVVTGGAVL